jgi:hypothetical protein
MESHVKFRHLLRVTKNEKRVHIYKYEATKNEDRYLEVKQQVFLTEISRS